MTSKKNITTFLSYAKIIKDYGVPAVALVLTILNLYLGVKLNPVLSDIKDIVHRVDAVETKVNTSEAKCLDLTQEQVEIKKDIYDELKYLRGRVDSIYTNTR